MGHRIQFVLTEEQYEAFMEDVKKAASVYRNM